MPKPAQEKPMKLFYELRVIDLAPTQYHTVRPWPVALALMLWAALITLVATAIRIEYAICVVASDAEAAAGAVADAIHIVATAGQAASRVIWSDLVYGLAELLIGKGLMGLNYA